LRRAVRGLPPDPRAALHAGVLLGDAADRSGAAHLGARHGAGRGRAVLHRRPVRAVPLRAGAPAVIRVVVAGIPGWTGSAVAEGVRAADDLELVAGVSRSAEYRSVADALDAVPADVVVDFTTVEAVKGNVLAALERGVNAVIGTSGLTADDFAEIDAAARA